MIRSEYVKQCAADEGFDLCGITRAQALPRNEEYFRRWLAAGYDSSLDYLRRNLDKRFDASTLMQGARTVIVCAVSYRSAIGVEGYAEGHRAKIASYACTTDYHITLKGMLRRLSSRIAECYPSLHVRMFVDTAPLLEKQLAVEAGLGWIGRQSLLVTPSHGSFVLLGELLADVEADAYDAPYEGAGCGECRRCIDSCPARAIAAPMTIDTTRCISRHTIEPKPSADVDLHGWIFGCDECQSCCPYNRKAPDAANAAFRPRFDPRGMSAEDWVAMSREEFESRFGDTPFMRSGWERMRAAAEINLKGGD